MHKLPSEMDKIAPWRQHSTLSIPQQMALQWGLHKIKTSKVIIAYKIDVLRHTE